MRNALCKPVTNRPLRFKRWSRKAYAAFVSIQHHVTIGQLSAHIADRFQVKNQSLHAAASCSEKRASLETEYTDEPAAELTAGLLQTIASAWAVATMMPVAEQTAGCQQAHTTNQTDHYR